MIAAVLYKQKHPLVIRELTIPALTYGQVLVKMFYSTICGTQINEYLGKKGQDNYLPHLLGHEGSGVVEMVGPGVTTTGVGDKVILHWRIGKGINSHNPTYMLNNVKINAGPITTFSDYTIVSENRLTKIPDETDMKSAPLYGCAITTAFGILQNESNFKCGQSITIIGTGGVGSALILAAKMLCANPIIAVDITEYKLEKSLKLGADYTINNTKSDFKKEVNKILKKGADIVIETTGINAVKEQAYELTNEKGTTVFVGVTPPNEKMKLDTTPLHFGKRILYSYGGSSQPDKDIPRLLSLENQGKLSVKELITDEFKLEEINNAFEFMIAQKSLRCVLKLNNDQ